MALPISTSKVNKQSLLGDAPSFLASPRFLRTRLIVYSLARFGVAAAIVAGAWFAPHVVGVENLPIGALHLLALLLVLVNGVVFAILHFGAWQSDTSHWRLMLVMHVTINLDFIFLTAALWLVGGAASPFASFYVVHIILAAMLLPREAVFFHALFGYFLFAGLVLSQWMQFAPVFSPEGIIVSDAAISGRYAITALTVQAILFSVTALLVSEMAAALKRGEQALSALNNELEHLAEMRRDFLHVVTHNLKAPAAAATMLLETVETLWTQDISENARTAISRARQRTQELGTLVQELQQLSALESGALKDEEKIVNLNDIARGLADSYQDEVKKKHLTLECALDAGLPDIHAVPRLVQEAAANYVTNAIKYTPDNGRIVLRTRVENGGVVFEVEDNGVGVPQEHIGKLFNEFVRAPAEVAGARPPGIGLGLSIVKRIMEYYGGRVYVKSEFGKGSVFGFSVPVAELTPSI